MKTSVKILNVVLLVLDITLAVLVFCPVAFHGEGDAVLKSESASTVETVVFYEPTLSEETEAPETEPVPATQPDEEFILSFVGDCTLGTSPAAYYAPVGFIKTVGDDISYPFKNVASYFEEDDFTMANLEGVLADGGNPIAKEHCFRGPVEYAKILSQASVEAVSLANNHTFDYGKKGYASTMAALQGEGVSYVENDSILVVQTQRGLKIGIYGMTYANMSKSAMLEGINTLKSMGG